MTLILARASAEFVLQVTDRLTTITSNMRPYDKLANKNILYFASNAVVAIAYTGDAYLENVPTDHWMAEKLIGVKIDPDNPPMMNGLNNKTQRDIGQSFNFLRNELKNQKGKKLLISIQGWQWNSKGRLRPLVGYISRKPPTNTFDICYESRYWHLLGAALTIATPDANITANEQNALSDLLRHKPAAEAESILVL